MGINSKQSKGLVFALLLASIPGAEAARLSGQCKAAFDGGRGKASSGLSGDSKKQDYSRVLVEFVKQKLRLPTLEEFAAFSGIELQQVQAFFSAKGAPKNFEALLASAKKKHGEGFASVRARMLAFAAEYLKGHYVVPTEEVLSDRLGTPVGQLELIFGETKDLYAEIFADPKYATDQIATLRHRVLTAYAKRAKEIQETPSMNEIAGALSISIPDAMRLIGEGKLFRDEKDLDDQARAKAPKAFLDVTETKFLYTPERAQEMLDDIVRADRVVITTAVSGKELNEGFFQSLLLYAKEKNAVILVIPENNRTFGLPVGLVETDRVHVVFNSVELAPWLKVSNINILQTQMNPLMSLDRLGPRGQTWVVASPKAFAKTVSTAENSQRHMFRVSTGALTENSNDSKHEPGGVEKARRRKIAKHEHWFGAVVLEKNASRKNTLPDATVGDWHLRRIEYVEEMGGFSDLGKFYTAKEVRSSPVRMLTFGDTHVGDTDPWLMMASMEQLMGFDPEAVRFQDLVNGHSISHWDKQNALSVSRRIKEDKYSLQGELENVASFLNAFFGKFQKTRVGVIPANHDFWLVRYLMDEAYRDEPHNKDLAEELAVIAKRGENVLLYALRKFGLAPEYEARLTIMENGESWKVGSLEGRKVLVGEHGHKGANGKRGSMADFRRGADRAIFGHTHTLGWENGTVNDGTSTFFELPYNSGGFSSWVKVVTLVTDYGEMQPLIFQNGEFYSPEGLKMNELGSQFFPPKYPRVTFDKETARYSDESPK